MAEWISEQLTPRAASFDAVAMSRGEPGLPLGFTWRDREYDVVETLATWKESSPEGGRAGGQVYLRRHYFKVRVSTGDLWTVYFVRQNPRIGNPRLRWFLYTVEEPG
jgi:hypothetical protein